MVWPAVARDSRLCSVAIVGWVSQSSRSRVNVHLGRRDTALGCHRSWDEEDDSIKRLVENWADGDCGEHCSTLETGKKSNALYMELP